MGFESPKFEKKIYENEKLMKMVEDFLRELGFSKERIEEIKKVVRQLEARGFSVGEIKEFLSWVKMSQTENAPEKFEEEILLKNFLDFLKIQQK